MSNTTATEPKSKLTTVINEYQYTTAMADEIESAIANQTYKNMITPVIIIAVCAFFIRREIILHKTILAVIYAIIAVGCIVAIAFSASNAFKRKKAAMKAFHDSYGNDGYAFKIVLEGNHIRSFINGKRDFDFKKQDVRGAFETERFYFFQLTGDKYLPMKKGSFTKGNVDLAREFNPLRNNGRVK